MRADDHSGLQRSHAREHAQTFATRCPHAMPTCDAHMTHGKNCWGDVGGDDDGVGVDGVGGSVDGITTCRSYGTQQAHIINGVRVTSGAATWA